MHALLHAANNSLYMVFSQQSNQHGIMPSKSCEQCATVCTELPQHLAYFWLSEATA
jgi:hypothetical protein